MSFLFYLTLTSVVFESLKIADILNAMPDLTLTSVVFEFAVFYCIIDKNI